MQDKTRSHKSTVFALLCEDKRYLLSLYNGVNNSSYENPGDLTVTTLESAVYMKMKNDASVVIDHRLNLYEHQSTVNPNIPLRDLHYVSEVYRNMVPTRELYRSSRILIPEPKFYCFYNGTQKQPERVELRLSEMFESKDGEPQLELVVTMLNINRGYNEELVKNCVMLDGYCKFVEKVRANREEMSVRKAVDTAVDWCISEGILADFFTERRNEVVEMSYFDFDEEGYKQILREEAYESGYGSGYDSGYDSGYNSGREAGQILNAIQIICKMHKKGRSAGQIVELLEEDEDFVRAICTLADDYAPDYNITAIYEKYTSEK